MIYWVAIEEVPSKKEQDENNAMPKLVLPPVAVSARDDKDAAIKVALDPANATILKDVDKNRMSVVVRPF